MRRPSVARWATAVALVVTVDGLGGQPPPAAIRIVSPADGAYVTGPMVLRALVEPDERAADVRRVRFFATGRFVCQIESPPFECDWDAGADVSEHVIRVVAELSGGDRLSHEVRTKDAGYVERVAVDAVHVTVSVTDRRGRFVQGLTPDAFTVFEDGESQPITYFAAEDIPLEIVVAVDVSQSMREAIPTLKAAVQQFLTALRPQDSVTLAAFNDNFFTLLRPEVDDDRRRRAVNRLSAWGGTALYDAIVKSLELFGSGQGRRALVIFTDGHDESSRLSMEAVQRVVEERDVILYLVAQGRALQLSSLKALLERFADVTGGRAFFIDQMAGLERTFDDIVQELSNQYLVAYTAPSTTRDGTWRTIRVAVRPDGYRVRARQGYRTTTRRP